MNNRVFNADDFSRKIRATCAEFGQDCLDGAIVIHCEQRPPGHIECGIPYMYAPTVSGPKLINVHYEIAKFFEDI